jgi:beta-glucanase (GH16 family)
MRRPGADEREQRADHHRDPQAGALRRTDSALLLGSHLDRRFADGVAETRIRMPGTGSRIIDWPAFWADGQRWPTDGEIDVVEGIGGMACYHFHYAGGGPGGCTTVKGAVPGWHRYAADWQPGSITYRYDGVPVWQHRTGGTSKPIYLVVDLALSNSQSPPNLAPERLRVAYVRVYQRRVSPKPRSVPR